MIPSESAHLFVAGFSHPGRVREINEDRYAVAANQLQDDTPSLFAIVADGIGGHRAGEVAAELAVETISKLVTEHDGGDPTEILNSAIIQTGNEIASQAREHHDQRGMGATCACVWVLDDRLFIAFVGDSRIYLSREGKIIQLSIDHTWVQKAIEHGILTPEQARNHPNAHVIRRYLGSSRPVNPDLRLRMHPEEDDQQSLDNQGMRLLPGDQLLLCTDGLTDYVEDEEILSLMKVGSLESSIKNLINLANTRGGHDNITALALEVPQTIQEDKSSPQSSQIKMSFSKLACLGISVVLLVIIAFLTTLVFFTLKPKTTPTPTMGISSTISIDKNNINGEVSPTPPEATVTPFISVSPTITQTPPQVTYTPWPTSTNFSSNPFIALGNRGSAPQPSN